MVVPRWLAALITIGVLSTVSIGAAVSLWNSDDHVRRIVRHDPNARPTSRVIHLSLAGRSHLTRYVLRQDKIPWEDFLSGVQASCSAWHLAFRCDEHARSI